jgi:hypothetical protein
VVRSEGRMLCIELRRRTQPVEKAVVGPAGSPKEPEKRTRSLYLVLGPGTEERVKEFFDMLRRSRKLRRPF